MASPADPEADPPAVLITFDPEIDTAESIATLLADAISMNVMDSMVVQRGLNSDQLIITGADKVEIVGQSSLRLFGSTHQTNNRVNLEHDAGTTFTQTVPGDIPSAVFRGRSGWGSRGDGNRRKNRRLDVGGTSRR